MSTDDGLRGAPILAGRRIVKLNFGRCDDPALAIKSMAARPPDGRNTTYGLARPPYLMTVQSCGVEREANEELAVGFTAPQAYLLRRKVDRKGLHHLVLHSLK